MATTTATNGAVNGTTNGAHGAQHQYYRGAGNPLSKEETSDSARLPAFGGAFQPGAYAQNRKFANPAPLGLSAFALTTFLLSLINLGTRGIMHPNIVVASAFGYGGLVQLLAGMWEMAVGNTFGATALSSFGGFWISFAIVLTPGGFDIVEGGYGGETDQFHSAFGLFLFGWFIFTFLLTIATLRSTVAFFSLFFVLTLTFLMLGIAYCSPVNGKPHPELVKAGGGLGVIVAFIAWYNALAGILDSSNSFFTVPVAHFPWSDKGRERRGLRNQSTTV